MIRSKEGREKARVVFQDWGRAGREWDCGQVRGEEGLGWQIWTHT